MADWTDLSGGGHKGVPVEPGDELDEKLGGEFCLYYFDLGIFEAERKVV